MFRATYRLVSTYKCYHVFVSCWTIYHDITGGSWEKVHWQGTVILTRIQYKCPRFVYISWWCKLALIFLSWFHSWFIVLFRFFELWLPFQHTAYKFIVQRYFWARVYDLVSFHLASMTIRMRLFGWFFQKRRVLRTWAEGGSHAQEFIIISSRSKLHFRLW